MDLKPTVEQAAIRAEFAAFSDREVRPLAAELDERPRFPRGLFNTAGELGLFAMRYPPPDGVGADGLSFAIAIEEIARGSLAVAACCAMQSLMGTTFVHRFAEGAVRERLLGPALRGEVVGTICMTEPDSGSDLMSMRTRARDDGGTWRISGSKTWITSAPVAGMFTVFARTGEDCLSVFLVEREAPGVTVGKAIEKGGVRCSVTSEVAFHDTPATALLGEPDQGAAYLKEVLADIRVMTAALAVGIARAAMDDAVAYAAERRQFGKPINRFQAVQHHLSQMAVDVRAAQQMTYWAAWRADQGLGGAHDAAMAKLFASEAAARVCDRAARVHASYGFAKEYAVERYLRDVRFLLIGGGTSEILHGVIARGLKP